MEKGKIRRLENITDEEKKYQEYFISEAENKTEEYLQKYKKLESSLNGNYICSDLMKETFEDYGKSIESRKKLSTVIHNSAAVLANEQFQNKVKDSKIKTCIFLTGVPGAGKSFLVQSLAMSGAIEDDTMIYEGDITTKTIYEKMDAVKENGKNLMIIVVNPTLRLAQENAIKRHFEIGRGASCATMARIISGIPQALTDIKERYPDIELGIYNKETNYDIETDIHGFSHLSTLNHGNYDEVKEKLEEYRLIILEELKKKVTRMKEEEIKSNVQIR